jgi:hypothetical protein
LFTEAHPACAGVGFLSGMDLLFHGNRESGSKSPAKRKKSDSHWLIKSRIQTEEKSNEFHA